MRQDGGSDFETGSPGWAGHSAWAARCLPHAIAAVIIALAFWGSVRATQGLSAPPEIDHYRDIGAAQSLLDGNRGEDPAYRGERWWYPPLMPMLTASIAHWSGISLLDLYTRGGAYLNLAGPVAFYVLGCTLLGAWPALCALAAFLFVAAWSLPSWGQATYCPWLWPFASVLPLFCLTVMCWVRALRTGLRRWDLASGLLLGFTFLGHAAPALIAAGTVVGSGAFGHRRPLRRHWEGVATVGLVALAVSAPYLVPLAVRYGFHVANPSPGRAVGLWGGEALTGLMSVRGVGAGMGAWWLWRQRSAPEARSDTVSLLTVLLLITGGLFSYGLAVQKLEAHGILLPLPVPAFHFHYYFTVLVCLLFGVGAWEAGGTAANAVAARFSWPGRFPLPVGPTAAVMLVTVLALLHAPSYLQRDDVLHWPSQSRRWALDRVQHALYAWARQHAGPGDVVAVDDHHATFSVVAAGRHVVALDPLMSSPYVPVEPRGRDRDAMLAALCRADPEGLRTLARKHGVTFVASVAPPEGAGCPTEAIVRAGLPLAHEAGLLRVFSVEGGAATERRRETEPSPNGRQEGP